MEASKTIYVGIRREDWSVWERRVPLIPRHLREITIDHPNIRFVIQPCGKRAIPDRLYEEIGAEVKDDLSQCSLVIGIKRPLDEKTLMPNRTYLFFGHVHKAQENNMGLLQELLDKKIRFIDIEHIKDDSNKRVLYFGKFGGIAGTIDFLAGFGHFVLKRGISTPFLNVGNAFKYFNLGEAYTHIERVGQEILHKRLPKDLCPLIFAILGNGRVSHGTWKVLQNLPVRKVVPEDLAAICADRENPVHRTKIYVVTFTVEHLVARKDGGPLNVKEYFEHPELYKSVFAERYFPYVSVIFNNLSWDLRYPRVLTKRQLRDCVQAKRSRLLGVCDVTCDLHGSIEFMEHYTNPGKPFYVYDPVTENISWQIEYAPNNVLYMAYDSLASELGQDSSEHCSRILKSYIPQIAESSVAVPPEKANLPQDIVRAVVTWNGQLAHRFSYVERLREQLKLTRQRAASRDEAYKVGAYLAVKMTGHLFDTMIINRVYDQLKKQDLRAQIVDQYIGKDQQTTSQVVMQIFGRENAKVATFKEWLKQTCSEHSIILEDIIETREPEKVNSQFRMKL